MAFCPDRITPSIWPLRFSRRQFDILSNDKETTQTAFFAVFLKRGTIPMTVKTA
jgi:hypothetical protein